MTVFSMQELDIASDPYILLIKNRVMEKVNALMGELELSLHTKLQGEKYSLPSELNLKHGKISRGENYRNLPFVILDYPAFFTKKDILAFRTMFYWGHFASFTAHLQGKYNKLYGKALIDEFLDKPDCYFCVNETPWEYLYKPDNYQKTSDLTKGQMYQHQQEKGFVKISTYKPVTALHDLEEPMMEFYTAALNIISVNNPSSSLFDK